MDNNSCPQEKAKYDEATKDVRKTLEDIDKAIAALSKGMGKSFLQTNAASELRALFTGQSDTSLSLMDKMDVADQRVVSSFLESKKDYAPQGGEIVGILKMMKDNFDEVLFWEIFFRLCSKLFGSMRVIFCRSRVGDDSTESWEEIGFYSNSIVGHSCGLRTAIVVRDTHVAVRQQWC